MAKKITPLTENDRVVMANSGVRSLPNDPSAKGFNPAQIKARIDNPALILFKWVQNLAEETGERLDKAPVFLSALPTDFSSFDIGDVLIVCNEGEVAFYDHNGSKIGNGLKATKEEIDTIASYFVDEKAKKAIADELGRNIVAAYATKDELSSAIGNANDNISTNASGIASLRTDVNANKTQLAKVGAWETRIVAVEEKVADTSRLDDAIASVESTLTASINEEKTAREEKVAELLGAIEEASEAYKVYEETHNAEYQALLAKVNAALDSNEVDLDQLSEIVAYIKSNKSALELLGTGKVGFDDIVANLTTNDGAKPLSASMGVELASRVTSANSAAQTAYSHADSVVATETARATGVESGLRTDLNALSASAGDMKFSYVFGTKDDGTSVTINDMLQKYFDANYYVQPSASMSNNIGTVEKGSTVTSVTVSWSFNKTMTSASIGGTSVLGSTSKTFTGSWSTQTSWTLTYGDGKNTKTASTTIYFRNKYYYGAKAKPSNYDSAFVRSLANSAFATSKPSSITADAGANQYIYLAYPKSFGEATFSVGGFEGGFKLVKTLSFTNASGYTEDYYIYESDNPNLGNTTATVR